MIILGINAYHGDVSAVLLRDGQLAAAVEEERFRRVKHCAGFPREAIRTCLDMARVTPKEVDHVAISRNPRANLLRKALFTLKDRLVTLRDADPAKVAVIHNWADRAALGGGARDSAFAREHGLVGRFIVMHAGNLGLSQGLESLVDAAARLVTDCPNLEVVFVGDGAKRDALERRARDIGARNIRFLPFLPREQMRESYGAADLFVVSLKAGLAGFIVPSKLYSILAAGKPYVAVVEEESEVAAITRQYGCGLLALPGDAGALADRFRTLYRDRTILERLSADAWKASKTFDRPVAVRAYHETLSGLL